MKIEKIITTITICLMAAACKNASTTTSASEQTKTPITTTAHTGARNKASKTVAVSIPVIDTMHVSEPYRLCEQRLTSKDYILGMCGPDDGTYDNEVTPNEAAFFVPEADIRDDELCRTLTLRYNYVAVMNRVVHAYELYNRKLPMAEDTVLTRKDTLDMIAHDQPRYRMAELGRYIKNPAALKEAKDFLAAYRRFDGNQEPLGSAFERYNDYYGNLPKLASEELLDDFEKDFWQWYDKRKHVPEIDNIIRLRLKGSDTKLTQEQYDRLTDAMYGEKDIDRRAILAIECAHQANGILQLGEIIESGIYTKYLLEVWLLWRAQVQMDAIGMSSFCTIPNNYYDMMRVKCMNTILRHMQTDPDKYDACLLENFIGVQVLHRQASIAGNESLAILANMKNMMFVHPSALGVDYLKQED